MKIIGLLINTKSGTIKASMNVTDSVLRKALVKPTKVMAILGTAAVPVTIDCLANNVTSRKLLLTPDFSEVRKYLGFINGIRVRYIASAGEPPMTIDVCWKTTSLKRRSRNAAITTRSHVEHIFYLKADVGRDDYHALYTKSYRDDNRLGVLLPKGVNWFCTDDKGKPDTLKLVACTRAEKSLRLADIPDDVELKEHFEKHFGKLLPELSAKKLEDLLDAAFMQPGTFIKE